MTLQEFRNSLGRDEPSDNLSFALAGLWWDAKGDWTRAHESAQRDEGPSGAWGHAYLHRKEGDDSNAGYWYRRASRRASRTCLDSEWAEITEALLPCCQCEVNLQISVVHTMDANSPENRKFSIPS